MDRGDCGLWSMRSQKCRNDFATKTTTITTHTYIDPENKMKLMYRVKL